MGDVNSVSRRLEMQPVLVKEERKKPCEKVANFLFRMGCILATFLTFGIAYQCCSTIREGCLGSRKVKHIPKTDAETGNGRRDLPQALPQTQTPIPQETLAPNPCNTVIETTPQRSDKEIGFLKRLKEAKEEKLTCSKVKALCQIADELCELQKLDDASKILDDAQKSIPAHEGYSEIESLCKIAKVRMRITPGKVPQALEEAARFEEAARKSRSKPEESFHLWPLHVKPLCLLAEGFQEAGNIEKAKELINQAIECANRNQVRVFEYLSNHMVIAQRQSAVGLIKDTMATVQLVEKDTPSLGLFNVEVTIYTMIIKLMISIKDHEKAQAAMPLAIAVMAKAEKAFQPYENRTDYSSTKKELEEARQALQKARES